MMHDELENACHLYSEKDEDVLNALREKKDWILKTFYVKGNIDTCLDSRGRVHYPMIEALLDDVLLFYPLEIPFMMEDKEKRLSSWNERFEILDLYEEEPQDAPFVLEYDFNLLDRQAYNALMPNFYHGVDMVFENQNSEEVLDLLRVLFQKKKGNNFILLDQSALIRHAFFAPILTKIIAYPLASEELKEELKSIAKEKEIPYEERGNN